jgi:hypothetical protein
VPNRAVEHFYQRIVPLMTQMDIAVQHVVNSYNNLDTAAAGTTLEDLEMVASPFQAILEAFTGELMAGDVPREWFELMRDLTIVVYGWRLARWTWQLTPGTWSAIEAADKEWVTLSDRMQNVLTSF